MKLQCDGGLDFEVTWGECGLDDAPVVVIWPAFGTPATYYRHLTPSLQAAGLTTLVVEYPGRERPDGINRRTDYGYDALVEQVHPAVMRHVRARHPRSPVVVLGHSLGGQVAIFAGAVAQASGEVELQPEGIILAASASPYWRGYDRRGILRSYLGTAAMALVARGVGYWPGDRLRFWGRQSRVLVADWSRMARTGRIAPQGAQQDYQQALAAFTGDVLAISFPDDPLAPATALDQLLRLIPDASVERWHASTRLGHIQWVRHHDEVVPVIVDWVQKRVASGPTPDARHTPINSGA